VKLINAGCNELAVINLIKQAHGVNKSDTCIINQLQKASKDGLHPTLRAVFSTRIGGRPPPIRAPNARTPNASRAVASARRRAPERAAATTRRAPRRANTTNANNANADSRGNRVLAAGGQAIVEGARREATQAETGAWRQRAGITTAQRGNPHTGAARRMGISTNTTANRPTNANATTAAATANEGGVNLCVVCCVLRASHRFCALSRNARCSARCCAQHEQRCSTVPTQGVECQLEVQCQALCTT
jgi:hypothetical protein